MKYCSNCGEPLNDNSKYCPSCGALQNVGKVGFGKGSSKPSPIILVLSILTLLGSAGGMIRGFFYQTLGGFWLTGLSGVEHYNRGYIFMLLNLGTFMGAMLMLMSKRIGYYIYLLLQFGYLFFIFYITFAYTTANDTTSWIHPNLLFFITGAFFWLPSIIMLMLYLTIGRSYFIKK